MRKHTIRSGMRLVLAALVVIIITSFYYDRVAEILSLSLDAELRIYRLGIFCAAAWVDMVWCWQLLVWCFPELREIQAFG